MVTHRIPEVQQVSDDARHDEAEGDEQLPVGDPRTTIEAYETEDGIVLYDAQNPLAWLKASHARPVDQTR